MHSFNKLLMFSKKKNAKVTFYGTLILLYIHNTNTQTPTIHSNIFF